MGLLLKCMKHINDIAELGDIDDSPLAQNVDTDFLHPRADHLHWFPITWFEPVLNRAEFKACRTASFIWEIPKIIETRSHEV